MKLISLSLPDPNPSGSNVKINPPPGIPTGGLGQGEAGQRLIQLGIEAMFVAVVILTIIFLLASGIQWIMSGGDKEKIQKAKNRLTYSIIGLIVTASAFLIVRTVITLLGGTPSGLL